MLLKIRNAGRSFIVVSFGISPLFLSISIGNLKIVGKRKSQVQGLEEFIILESNDVTMICNLIKLASRNNS